MLSHSEERHPRNSAVDAPFGRAAILDELMLATEELSAAEEELRAQNERLLEAHGALVEERERYRALFELAPVAYVVTDIHGAIRSANRASAKLFACRPDRLSGKPIVVFTQDASRRRLRGALHALGTTRESIYVTFNVRDRRGRLKRVEATVSVMRDIGGEIAGARWLIVNRTKRARRELARRARATELEALVAQRTAQLRHEQELKDRLVANVSHEFRTGLAAIGGYAELLSLGVRGAMTTEQLTDVRRISDAYGHLAHIVDDLLSYSKLTSGTLTLDVSEITVVDAMRAMINLIAPQARTKAIEVSIEGGDTSLVVVADGERLRQIVLNLLSNAVKFTPRRGRIAIGSRADGDEICIYVRDTGSGIPVDKMDEVFQPFVRLRSTSGESGTGLGLAISRELARAMRGDLTVCGVPDGGSVFSLRLPRSTRFATTLGG